MDTNTKPRCAVLGYGSWATAIVKTLTVNHHHVDWLVLNEEIRESLQMRSRNPKYLPWCYIDQEFITPSDDINAVVRDAEIVILAMPSAFFKKFLEPLSESLANKIVVSAVKGIIPGDYLTIVEHMNRYYDVPMENLAVVTGPSHAEEVGQCQLSYLTVASESSTTAERVRNVLANDFFRCSVSNDVLGVEAAAIMKNIYALAVGMAVGLRYGDNFLAVLIAGCSAEMKRFIDEAVPVANRDINAAAYMGDLLVTCYSPLSRNRRLGTLLGKGCSVKSALNEMTMIAEGYYAADCIRQSSMRRNIDMPIADKVWEVLYEGASARDAMQSLTQILR
ncbi:MAG: NAD(P)H-dependent glycerol-3-phosphate dehydrogenase [Alistipes sp.]|jgi:glycerol-3-phosphate dehydrogenase (NAD(P)+)|nr:NAD(P)H-dependent glycerol-3-phosphate dehydrogenase [Alistipes sp.]